MKHLCDTPHIYTPTPHTHTHPHSIDRWDTDSIDEFLTEKLLAL